MFIRHNIIHGTSNVKRQRSGKGYTDDTSEGELYIGLEVYIILTAQHLDVSSACRLISPTSPLPLL